MTAHSSARKPAVHSSVPLSTPQTRAGFSIGAEVWIEKSGDAEPQFRAMAAAGFSTARIFVYWAQLEREPGRWDFTVLDEVFAAASACGLGLLPTLHAFAAPSHLRDRGWSLVTGDAVMRAAEEEYIGRVVRRYRDHPALRTWVLWNEPGEAPKLESPFVLGQFRAWLRERYGDIAKLNAAWSKVFASFDEVVVASGENKMWSHYPIVLDGQRFYRHLLAWRVGQLAAAVRRDDPRTPTHINPHALLANPCRNSLDLPLLAANVDELGASCHPSWHFSAEMMRHSDQGVGFLCDLLRPAAGGKPFAITELQGGTTEICTWQPLCPTQGLLERWLWEIVFSGASSAVFWLWKARRAYAEGGEWGLTDLRGRSTERVAAGSRIAEVLKAHAGLFAGGIIQPRRVAILVDLDAQGFILRRETGPQNPGDRVMISAFRYYRALRQLGIPVDVVTTGGEVPPDLSRYAWLIAPDCRALTPKTAQTITEAVAAGAHLWVDGICGLADPDGVLAECPPLDLTEVLGAELAEFRWMDPCAKVRVGRKSHEIQGSLSFLDPTTARPIAWCGKSIVGVSNIHGKGCSRWMGWSIADQPDADAAVALWAKWLREAAEAAGVAMDDELPPGVHSQLLETGSARLALWINATDTDIPLRRRKVVATSQPGNSHVLEARGWAILNRFTH